MTDLQVLNAILYVAEHSCKWCILSRRYLQLSHDLFVDEPLVEERGSASGVRGLPIGADRVHQDELCDAG